MAACRYPGCPNKPREDFRGLCFKHYNDKTMREQYGTPRKIRQPGSSNASRPHRPNPTEDTGAALARAIQDLVKAEIQSAFQGAAAPLARAILSLREAAIRATHEAHEQRKKVAMLESLAGRRARKELAADKAEDAGEGKGEGE